MIVILCTLSLAKLRIQVNLISKMSYVVKILMLFIFVFNITFNLTDNGSQYLRQLLENYQQVNYTYILRKITTFIPTRKLRYIFF